MAVSSDLAQLSGCPERRRARDWHKAKAPVAARLLLRVTRLKRCSAMQQHQQQHQQLLSLFSRSGEHGGPGKCQAFCCYCS